MAELVSVFASSAGSGTPLSPVYPGDGLTPLGVSLVEEMNRLGSESPPRSREDAGKFLWRTNPSRGGPFAHVAADDAGCAGRHSRACHVLAFGRKGSVRPSEERAG